MAFDYDAVPESKQQQQESRAVCSDLLASDLSRIARYAGEKEPTLDQSNRVGCHLASFHIHNTTMLTLLDELSYSVLYFPRYRGMPITTIWQNYPILSYPILVILSAFYHEWTPK